MNEWQSWFAIVGGLFGIVAVIGGALVVFRGSYNKARIEALRADVDDYARREQRHEQQRIEDRGKIETLEAKVTALENENNMLRELATQRAAVSELAIEVRELIVVLKTHHIESTEAWERIEGKLSNA